LHHLDIALRLSPRDFAAAGLYSAVGMCHLVAGRYGPAVEAERRAVALKPQFGSAWRTFAAAAGLADDLTAARHALTQALLFQPMLSLAWIEAHHPLADAGIRARYARGLAAAGLE
jgi:tetratricopeptide (TPR) repeat protein